MEAHGAGVEHAYDRAKQLLHLETDRGTPLREALRAIRNCGTLAMIGVWA